MNKIELVNDQIKECVLDDTVELTVLEKNELFDVNSVKIHVKKDTCLDFVLMCDEKSKLDVYIKVDPNVHFSLFELYQGKKMKVQYKYYLEASSCTNVFKFHDSYGFKEYDLVYLNGVGASFDCHMKTISKLEEKYDFTIYHNYRNTVSNIHTGGVNIMDGILKINVSGIVLNNKKNCVLNQYNRIVNMTRNTCFIQPNLFIDEYEVEANHSAFIGMFHDDELFYLQSRGIKEQLALNLLIKGFLLDGLYREDRKMELVDLIDHYWR